MKSRGPAITFLIEPRSSQHRPCKRMAPLRRLLCRRLCLSSYHEKAIHALKRARLGAASRQPVYHTKMGESR